MISKLFGFFGGSKIMWITIAVLATTTAALGYTSKRLYDSKQTAVHDLEFAKTQFAASITAMAAEVSSQEARYAALTTAFKGQQKDYALARTESRRLRKQISELAKASPEVQELVDTPIPADLYQRVFPGTSDN